MFEHADVLSTRAPVVASSVKLQRQTRSFDFHSTSFAFETFIKDEDKEQLLNPERIPPEIKHSLIDLHRQSIEHLATNNFILASSKHDISRRKSHDSPLCLSDKRHIHESPV
jgi:hypothetical protein